MRTSNFAVPTMPTLRPKLRKVPRRSFSMAIAFDCNSLRWVSLHERRRGLVYGLLRFGNRLDRVLGLMSGEVDAHCFGGRNRLVVY